MTLNKNGTRMRALAIPARARKLRDAYSMANRGDSGSSTVVGSLILDSKGIIHCCSAAVAQLAGVPEDEMAGHAIKSLIPDFPLDAGTQGYNVAFVSFLTASGRAHSAKLQRADGSTIAVEAWTNLLQVNKEYLICLELHCAHEQQDGEMDSMPRPARQDAQLSAAATV